MERSKLGRCRGFAIRSGREASCCSSRGLSGSRYADFEHRAQHKHVDHEDDPYNIREGPDKPVLLQIDNVVRGGLSGHLQSTNSAREG